MAFLEKGIRYRKGLFVTSHMARVYAVDFDVEEFETYFWKKIRNWLWVIRFIEIHTELCPNIDCFVVVRYEHIVSSDIKIRTEEMLKILRFLLTADTFTIKYRQNVERIGCILNLKADDQRMMSFDRHFESWNRIHSNVTTNVTVPANSSFIQIDDALRLAGDAFVCRCWNKIKSEASRYGYSLWKDTIC